MIIVSQSKRELINLDNINLVGTDGEGVIRARLGMENNTFLGAYSTEKRAKEVLEEIMDSYQTTELFKCTDTENQNEMANEYLSRKKEPFKYEMPAEWYMAKYKELQRNM